MDRELERPPPGEADPARRELFAAEVDRLMDRLYGTALRLARDPDDAEDIVAETVTSAWARLDQLREPEHLEGWLFQILNNTFVSLRRRRRSREDCETSIEHEHGGTGFSLYQMLHQPGANPEEQFLNGLLREDLQRALDAVPDPYRVAIVLVEIQGYTYDETARLLGVPKGTVRSRLSRGRALLQQGLWEQAREAGLVDEKGGETHR